MRKEKFAAIYPGQGSQHIGMGKFLFDNFKYVRELFECASDTLDLDFKRLCHEGDENTLSLTANAQPALVLVSTSYYKVLTQEIGLSFDIAMGHSLGEYSALVNSNCLDFEQTLVLVKTRGEFMQSAVPLGEGGMIAVIGLNAQQCQTLCSWAQEQTGLSPIEIANHNATEQIVISGKKEICNWLLKNASQCSFDSPPRRLKLISLKVSAPFHCSLMKPAANKMNDKLNKTHFKKPIHPIIQNFSAKACDDPSVLRETLIQQIINPVRWVESVQELKNKEVSLCIELGSGKTLSGLMKKIDNEYFKTLNINSIEDLKEIKIYV